MAVGIRPNIALASRRAGGRPRRRGRRRHAHLRSRRSSRSANASSIAAGVYGLVAPMLEMCDDCADGLAERPRAAIAGSVTVAPGSRSSGIDMFSAGDFTGGDGDRGHRVPRRRRAASTSGWSLRGRPAGRRGAVRRRRRRRLVFRSDAAAPMMSAPSASTLIFGQARRRRRRRAGPWFGRRMPDGGDLRLQRRLQGPIVWRHRRPGLTSLDEVRARTKASASCGSLHRRWWRRCWR